jgi:hypothetical protein
MKIVGILSLAFFITLYGCSLQDMFQQPQVTVLGYELVELPGDQTKLLVECDVKNMDSHDGDVKTVTYTAVIEGVTSLAMTYSTPFTMKGNQTLRMKLPLTLNTADDYVLLDKMNAGKSLNFTVTGKFTADTFLGRQELNLNVAGSANVTAGLENFFTQPSVHMDESQGFRVTNLGSPASPGIPNLVPPNPGTPVQVNIKYTIVSNLDTNSATVKKVVYTVNMQGVNSDKMTNIPSTPIAIAATGQAGSGIVLTNLPLNFNYTSFMGAIGLITGTNYYVNYTIKGTILVTANLGPSNIDFYLPLNTSGSNTILVSPL